MKSTATQTRELEPSNGRCNRCGETAGKAHELPEGYFDPNAGGRTVAMADGSSMKIKRAEDRGNGWVRLIKRIDRADRRDWAIDKRASTIVSIFDHANIDRNG